MKNRLKILVLLLLGFSFALTAQTLPKEGYVNWGPKTSSGNFATDFVTGYNAWTKGQAFYNAEDDNFFISRVKPKLRFRNEATQANKELNETNDKRILMWVPMNNTPNNALPDGKFDSEVFSMWSYIHHYGNWTAPFIRMPGNFADVAHKNGVGVSVLASIPNASLSSDWERLLNSLINSGADKTADLLAYYGIDGMGYNSEFYTTSQMMDKIIGYHKDLYKKTRGNGRIPLYEMNWYDGTGDNGGIFFDRGLGDHNDGIFGTGAEPVTTAMFFNYNWNNPYYINQTKARAAAMNRNLLDIYAGLNMQGAEPKYGKIWPYLKETNYSIGLWGAHSQNMFFESRGEQGANPDLTQRIYQLRLERYFNGGNRNPVNRPPISDRLMQYNAYNYNFMGMAEFTSAKSSLSWNLAEEPFITYFNLGNGKFFNLNGERAANKEWYNIGIQDYLPTWRWWFSKTFLGSAQSESDKLDAEFVWDDAWYGGSTMRIWGKTTDEYLHLFKTKFALAEGDVITLRYKVRGGTSDIKLALSHEDSPTTPVEVSVADAQTIKAGRWIEKKIVVGESLNEFIGKNLAVVALRFENAQNINVYLGEFSIIRGSFDTPVQPVDIRTTLLKAHHQGVDGKIIFNMPNTKQPGDVCYNLDVKTSQFKLYAQQKDADAVFVGATTSWAGLYFAAPFNFDGTKEVRFGVSAVSLDMKGESQISWGDYIPVTDYTINDDIHINKTTIKPNESFTISFVDALHEPSKFELIHSRSGDIVKVEENAIVFDFPAGLPDIGEYDLKVTGNVLQANGTRGIEERVFGSFVQITSEALGALPEIYTLTANQSTEDVTVEVGESVFLEYTGRDADGASSRGIDLQEQAFGFKASELGLTSTKSFTLAFWLKVNKYYGGTQLVNIRDKTEPWPKTDWGWFWNFLDKDGNIVSTTFRGSDASSNNEFQYDFSNVSIKAGPWTHMAYVFDFNESGHGKLHLYVNGVKQTPKGWKRTNTSWSATEPPYQQNLYPMRGENMVAIGGPHFSNGGIDGVVDNFQYWDKALTEEEVKLSMGDLETPPANLVGLWDIESEAQDDYRFASRGSSTGAAGRHDYQKSGGEGQGTMQWIMPAYTSGCPFITGDSYQVVTKPIWDIYMGEIKSHSGDGTAGNAEVSFDDGGVYTATLTLENGWGKDTKTFSYIIVGGTSVDKLGADTQVSLFPNPFVEQVNVKFADAGKYTVVVFDANGRLVSQQLIDVQANEFASIKVNGPKGLYMVNIKKGEKTLNTLKVIKK